VGHLSNGIEICGIPLLAKDARNGAPHVRGFSGLDHRPSQRQRTRVSAPHALAENEKAGAASSGSSFGFVVLLVKS